MIIKLLILIIKFLKLINKYIMKSTSELSNPIHIGEVVKKYIDANKIYKSALARKINKSDSTIIRYQKSSTLQTSILFELSHALKHNFFADIAAQLPVEYSTQKTEESAKNIQTILDLQKEIERLTIENNLLKSIISK